MQAKAPPAPPKPVSQIWRPDLTRLPRLHWRRRLFRGGIRLLARSLSRLLTRTEVRGLEHLPGGAALYVTNHLGDADTVVLLSALPFAPEALAKIDLLHEFPALWKLMDWYGVIWLHRGRVDRRALDLAVQSLRAGRSLVIAPEGRYTLTAGLERGTSGAAYVGLHAQVPIVPLALTDTQNRSVYSSLQRLRRPRLTLTIGEPFQLRAQDEDPRSLRLATQQIMESIARLLPGRLRGAYAASEDSRGSPSGPAGTTAA